MNCEQKATTGIPSIRFHDGNLQPIINFKEPWDCDNRSLEWLNQKKDQFIFSKWQKVVAAVNYHILDSRKRKKP